MVVEDLIEKCNDEYVRNATEYICKECSHQIKCTGNCAKCLDEVHFDRKNGTRSDYDCKYLLDYYVCRYIYAYITEMKRAFNIIKPEICGLEWDGEMYTKKGMAGVTVTGKKYLLMEHKGILTKKGAFAVKGSCNGVDAAQYVRYCSLVRGIKNEQ